MTRAKRTSPDKRRELILDAAIKLSVEIGYTKITRDKIAAYADVSSSLIAAHFPKMKDIKAAVMDAAISRDIIEIIAQGITVNDSKALVISKRTRLKVIALMFDRIN